MRIVTNDSPWSDAEARRMLRFAAKGTKHAGVVIVKLGGCGPILHAEFHQKEDGVDRWQAFFWLGQKGTRFPGRRWPKVVADQPWVARRFPDGIPIETLEDWLIFRAAFEFKQLRHRRAWAGLSNRVKYSAARAANDVALTAMRRLNRWRVETGREAVAEAKGSLRGLVGHTKPDKLRRDEATSPVAISRFVGLVPAREEIPCLNREQ